MAFVIVCAAVLILRRTNPTLHRPFRTPFVPFVPIAGIAMNLMMMFSLGWENWLRLLVWLAIGLVIYFTYGRHRSTVALRRELSTTGASGAGRLGDR
jgi:APA family basic amino acid/polyamine antiporter